MAESSDVVVGFKNSNGIENENPSFFGAETHRDGERISTSEVSVSNIFLMHCIDLI